MSPPERITSPHGLVRRTARTARRLGRNTRDLLGRTPGEGDGECGSCCFSPPDERARRRVGERVPMDKCALGDARTARGRALSAGRVHVSSPLALETRRARTIGSPAMKSYVVTLVACAAFGVAAL